ncbi:MULTISPECIES: hypothetical protein [unclassified Halomonas]|uniref:hypothetical protein n=1 Tax=unclassified Halomonas TaxID=2609666 RepID=UPI001BE8AD8F|nr:MULTISPECIES: hypothetical protein [unclassified Halomonas]MBT2786734.1 hypothetical protein [Halomonas sp. ISL-106]MBT2798614.1 hypothetical protein [Halomonas sp. ISL-104]
MWVRKPRCELEAEKNKRRVRYEKVIFLVLIVIFFWSYWQMGSFNNLLTIVKGEPQKAFALLFLPVFVYFGYRNYVLHGNAMIERPGKVCLACGNGMGYSDDGWRFKVYGTKNKKWYQIRACKTPEKCDIAYQFEVKWVESDEDS